MTIMVSNQGLYSLNAKSRIQGIGFQNDNIALKFDRRISRNGAMVPVKF